MQQNLFDQLASVTPVEWAYFAGIIDGEGCVTINTNRTRRTAKTYFYRHCTVTVANTDEAMIAWIRQRFGGCFSITRVCMKDKNRRGRTLYQIAWRNHRAVPILHGILPYLVTTKKQRAVLALEFIGRLRSRRGGPPLTGEEVRERDAIYERMRATYN